MRTRPSAEPAFPQETAGRGAPWNRERGTGTSAWSYSRQFAFASGGQSPDSCGYNEEAAAVRTPERDILANAQRRDSSSTSIVFHQMALLSWARVCMT